MQKRGVKILNRDSNILKLFLSSIFLVILFWISVGGFNLKIADAQVPVPPNACLCSGESVGGLVPCGRKTDDPTTEICECCPCTICHFFVLGKRVIDFIFKFVVSPLLLLMIVISGAKFVGSAGSPEKIEEAKRILLAAVIGFLVVLLTWLTINVFLSFLVKGRLVGPSDVVKVLGQRWDSVNCNPGKTCIIATCGNGIVEPGEECDGANLNGKTCSDFGFTSGTLRCDSDCKFDFTLCGRCGDGIVQPPAEECEPASFSTTCVDLGFDGGTLQCNNNCEFDTSLCWECGDGIVQGPEECEIGDTQTCTGTFTEGLPAHCSGIPMTGTKSCKSDCTWGDCVLGTPTITSHSSTACDTTSPAADDYACCELTSCGRDGCDCCGRHEGASTPSGYASVQALSPCHVGDRDDPYGDAFESESCRLSQSNSNPRNWIITTNHTTAYYRCWK